MMFHQPSGLLVMRKPMAVVREIVMPGLVDTTDEEDVLVGLSVASLDIKQRIVLTRGRNRQALETAMWDPGTRRICMRGQETLEVAVPQNATTRMAARALCAAMLVLMNDAEE